MENALKEKTVALLHKAEASPLPVGGDLMTHNCQKLEKYLFPGISGCILAPATGGPGKSSCSEGSEYVWQRGVGSQKCLVRGNFQSIVKGLIKSYP